MWDVRGDSVDPAGFTLFPPRETFVYYDGPRLFTFARSGGECLALWSDYEGENDRYVVVPCDHALKSQLLAGTVSVRDAITGPVTWVLDAAPGGETAMAWLVESRDIPDDMLPTPGVTLYRDSD